jgi:hypothetical protein
VQRNAAADSGIWTPDEHRKAHSSPLRFPMAIPRIMLIGESDAQTRNVRVVHVQGTTAARVEPAGKTRPATENVMMNPHSSRRIACVTRLFLLLGASFGI